MASLLVITAATVHRVWRAMVAVASTADTTIFEGSLASKDRAMVRASRDVTRRNFYTAVKTAYAFDFNELHAFKTKGDK